MNEVLYLVPGELTVNVDGEAGIALYVHVCQVLKPDTPNTFN